MKQKKRKDVIEIQRWKKTHAHNDAKENLTELVSGS